MRAVLARLASQRAGTVNRYELPFVQALALLLNERRPWLDDGPPCASEVRSVNVGGRSFRIQVYQPESCASQRVLIYLHGGGWCVGSPGTHDNIVRRLAASLCCTAWSVEYALAPEAPFPAGLLDCIAAVELARREYPDAGLVVGGDSAGANLALDVARRLRDRGQALIDALLLFYGVYTDACSGPSMQAYGDGRYGLSRAAHERYLEAYAGPMGRNSLARTFALHASADLHGLPRCWLAAAELDILRDQTHLLAEKLRNAHVSIHLDEVPGVTHGFLSYGRELPQVDVVVEKATRWVVEHPEVGGGRAGQAGGASGRARSGAAGR